MKEFWKNWRFMFIGVGIVSAIIGFLVCLVKFDWFLYLLTGLVFLGLSAAIGLTIEEAITNNKNLKRLIKENEEHYLALPPKKVNK